MNLQLERLDALTDTLKLPGIGYNAVDIAQQVAKQEWDYLQFLEQILTSEQQHRDQ